jgi:hypothetical protein
MSRREIITCDGCGYENPGISPVKVDIHPGTIAAELDLDLLGFSYDLCWDCLTLFAERWKALHPKNWPKGLEQQAAAGEAHQKDAASRQARFLATAEARRGDRFKRVAPPVPPEGVIDG